MLFLQMQLPDRAVLRRWCVYYEARGDFVTTDSWDNLRTPGGEGLGGLVHHSPVIRHERERALHLERIE